MTIYLGTFLDTPKSPFKGHHLRAEADTVDEKAMLALDE